MDKRRHHVWRRFGLHRQHKCLFSFFLPLLWKEPILPGIERSCFIGELLSEKTAAVFDTLSWGGNLRLPEDFFVAIMALCILFNITN